VSPPPGAATPVVGVADLARELAEGPVPVLLDVRWRLAGPPGLDSYRAGHLPGAVFVDLDRDLSGGRAAARRDADCSHPGGFLPS
jgi:thiosulfate/3-mercaptopyruvate sulfurtransferase